MEMDIYKSRWLNVFVAIFIKALVIIIPAFLISGILVGVLPTITNIYIFKIIFDYFGSWYPIELLIVILSFIYSITNIMSNYTTIKIDNGYFIVRNKGKNDIIDMKTTKFKFKEKVYDTTLLAKLTSNYIIQIISPDGYLREICCFAFDKKEYIAIKNKIKSVKEVL